jgi:hypothetical protein
MTPACSIRRSPTCRLVSLNVPEASTATYASNPLPTAVMALKATQASSEMPAKISFLRPVASMARATRASSKALTDKRSMTSMPGSASTSSGNVGPHKVSRRRGYDDRQLQRFRRFGHANRTSLLELAPTHARCIMGTGLLSAARASGVTHNQPHTGRPGKRFVFAWRSRTPRPIPELPLAFSFRGHGLTTLPWQLANHPTMAMPTLLRNRS